MQPVHTEHLQKQQNKKTSERKKNKQKRNDSWNKYKTILREKTESHTTERRVSARDAAGEHKEELGFRFDRFRGARG